MNELPYTIDDIRRMFLKNNIIWKDHAAQRMVERDIQKYEIKQCFTNGEIIETYITDKPFPSCLIMGYTDSNRPIHVLCSTDGEYVYIITAYIPDNIKWNDDLKTRRQK